MAFPDPCLDALLEAIPDAALVVATDGTIVRASPRAERLFGYPSGDLAGRSHDLLVPAASRTGHRRAVAAFFESPRSRPMAAGREVVGLRSDGSEFPAECFLSPLEAEGGRFALVVVRDLTDRRLEEKALQEREARYRHLFEANPHPMWVYDVETLAFLAVNDAAVRKYRYSRDEFLHRTIADIRPAEDVAPLRENVARVTEGLDEAGLWRHVTKDGRVLAVEIVSHSLDWEGRRAELVLAHDVTERRRAEEALRRRTAGLATLLGVSRHIAATLDMGRVLQATTDGAARLTGLDTAAVYLLEGNGDVRLQAATPPLPPGFPEALRLAALGDHPHLREAIESGRPVFLPDAAAAELTEAERAAASVRGLRSVLYLPLHVGVEPLGALIVGTSGAPRDLSEVELPLCRTLANLAALAAANARLYESKERHAAELEQEVAERRRAEAEREGLHLQLAQAQKMEAVGRLAGGVAHDFNNMLAVILGRAELALRRAGPEDPLRPGLEEIREAAERSAVLTRQLLAFARRQTVSPRVIDLNEAVGAMLQMLRRLIGEDIELVWAPGAGVGAVRIDPSQLDQLLANLVVNARDALAGSGRITLATRPAALAARRDARGEPPAPGDYALLTVDDNGAGMDGETLAHVFEPFFTTKGPGQGTGLGLSTVYGIVRQNGGFIDARSERGRGSTFLIYLPRAPEAAGAAGGGRDEEALPRGDETLLLVEDEASILELGSEMLEGLGYRVLSAGGPTEALRVAEAHSGPIHLLITDVVMPLMDGRALSERLAAARPGLPCLFLSGYTADVIAHRGVLDQGVWLLEKPFTLRQLAEKVRDVLRSPPRP